MREDIDLVQWASQQAVVALPVHMDAFNAGHIREELLSAINGSATALIADMTATTSCDHVGADVDHLVPIYPSLEAATAARPPAEALAVVAGPGLGGSRSWGGSTVGYGR
jgi:hypothetical protein